MKTSLSLILFFSLLTVACSGGGGGGINIGLMIQVLI